MHGRQAPNQMVSSAWRSRGLHPAHTAGFPLTWDGARLACKAFQDVFQRRQTRFAALLAWLESGLVEAWPTSRVERGLLDGVVGG